MVRPSLFRLALLALLIAAVPLSTGCGSNPFKPPIDPGGNTLPDNTPQADSPQNTMLRFEATYEYQVIGEYEKMFARDFRFTFSSQSDPNLVTQYGDSWGKDDEIESTRHLFLGFSDDQGVYHDAATSIDMQLVFVTDLTDPFHADSLDFYRLMSVTPLKLTINLANNNGFEVSAPHSFYLVRGDIAHLDAGQDALPNRWYIYRWDDLSPPLTTSRVSPKVGTASTTPQTAVSSVRTTWGAAKAAYRR